MFGLHNKAETGRGLVQGSSWLVTCPNMVGERASLHLPHFIYNLHDLVVAIQKDPGHGVSNDTGPRSDVIIPQDMFEVESCLSNGMQLLPCRNGLLLALGWSKVKGQ